VLLRALAKLPGERFATAAELEKALREADVPAAPLAAQRPQTVALVRSALALKPETAPVPALAPTPVPSAVRTAVPVAVPTMERRAYGGPSPRERAAARGTEPTPRRGGAGLAVMAVVLAGGAAVAWMYAPQIRVALGSGVQPPASVVPVAVTPAASAAPASPVAPTAGPRVLPLPAPSNVIASPAAPRPSQPAASAVPTAGPTQAPATPAPSAAASPSVEPPVAPVEASLDRAEELFGQGRFGSALAEAKAVLQREPGNRQAQQLAEDAEVELMVEKRLKEARDAMAAGDRDLALEKLKLGLAAKPTDSRLLALWREVTRD
jgi:hypothetical protein